MKKTIIASAISLVAIPFLLAPFGIAISVLAAVFLTALPIALVVFIVMRVVRTKLKSPRCHQPA